MQDRTPTQGQEGRVLITPENGSPAYHAKVEMADNPSQAGTPLNKATLLKDATAALFGLGTDAVPDDALKLLSRFNTGLGNEYMWIRGVYETADGDNLYGAQLMDPNVHGDMLLISDSVSISANGDVSLVEPTQQQASAAFRDEVVDNPSILRGKYTQLQNGLTQYANTICRVTPTATFYTGGRFLYCNDNSVYRVVTIISPIDYVNSADPAEYPPSEPDGYAYSPLGQLGDKVRIETGSYVGTGTYGADNPNSLTFWFAPKAIIIIPSSNDGHSYNEHLGIFVYGVKYPPMSFDGGGGGASALLSSVNTVTGWGSNTITWYNIEYSDRQLNDSDYIYFYFAIG